MMDRLLARTLNASVMCMIVATATGSVVLFYRGVFQLMTRHTEPGAGSILLAAVLAVGCVLLCRHRHELADS
jgi:hypothetical protein